MGKIGDLFVRLGLKSDGFKKGMQDAKKETTSFGDKLKNMKAGALAVWAAIGAGIMKVGKDFVSATNTMDDAFAKAASRIKASWHSILASYTNYKNDGKGLFEWIKKDLKWTKDTFGRAKAAGDAAAAMTEAFDAEFELSNSVKLQKAKIQQELNELSLIMRDRTRSVTERLGAVSRYKELYAPIAKAAAEEYSKMMNAAIDAWKANAGLSASNSDIIEYFENIGIKAEETAAKFPEIHAAYNQLHGDLTNQPIADIIEKWRNAETIMSDVTKQTGRVANSIRAEVQADLDAIAKAVKGYNSEDLKLEIDVELDTDELEELENWIDGEFEKDLQALREKLDKEMQGITTIANAIGDAVTQSFAGVTEALMDLAFGVEGADPGQITRALLEPLGQAAKSMGELYMSMGVAQLAMREGLKQPEALIAAGAALIAVGTAVTSGLKALYQNPTGGTTASTAQGTGTSLEKIEQEITINVVGQISGDKIILAGQKTLNKWSR